jgi:hypothetical protein
MFLSAGTHFIVGARIAPMRAALLHYKYLHDFEGNVRRDVTRGAQWNKYHASEYEGYLKGIDASGGLRLHSGVSRRFSGGEQLVGLGIMRPLAARVPT